MFRNKIGDLYFKTKGSRLIKINNERKLINHLTKVLELNPSHAEATFILAKLYQNNDDNEKAIYFLKRYLNHVPEDPIASYQLAKLLYQTKNYSNEEIITFYEYAIKTGDKALNREQLVNTYYHLGCIKYESDDQNSITYFEKVLEFNPSHTGAILMLAQLSQYQVENKKAIHFLKRYLNHVPEDPIASYQLAELLYQTKNYSNEEIITFYEYAIKTGDKALNREQLVNTYYHLGCIKYESDDQNSITYFEKVLEFNPSHAEATFMLAKLYQNKNDNEKAIYFLKRYLNHVPEDPIANYQLAELLYQTKKYSNEEIMIFYEYAIKTGDKALNNEQLVNAYYHLGCIKYDVDDQNSITYFEKAAKLSKYKDDNLNSMAQLHIDKKNLSLAILTYKKSILLNGKNADIYFKIGELLRKSNQYYEAIEFFEKSLDLDKIYSPKCYTLAQCYEDINDFENAEKWYKKAIERQQMHRPNNYRKLAYVLKKQHKNAEALEKFLEAEIFRAPSKMTKNNYDNVIQNKSVRYATFFEYYKVDNNMVFYESMNGNRIMGNPAGVFEYIYEHEDFKNFVHIWAINSLNSVPDKYRNKDNIIFVKKGSDAYMKYLCKAKFLICDSRFENYFVRKDEQKYLQTTHGIFYKTVGRDNNNELIGAAGATRNLLQATHILSPNNFMVEKIKSAYGIEGIFTGQMAVAGYPRIDITLNASKTEKENIKEELGIKNNKKVILYAPTWREKDVENNEIDGNKLVDDLISLSSLGAYVLFRGHPKTNNLIQKLEIPANIILPSDSISTNELLSITDLLISDYSSVFFDFIATERPIVHYLYDLKEYSENRGLNLNTSELPGFIAKTSEELKIQVEKGLKETQPSNKYLQAKDRFCLYDQGHSAQDISSWFFFDNDQHVNVVEKKVFDNSSLYICGELQNPKSPSFLISEINKSQKNETINSIIIKKKIVNDENKVKILQKLDINTNILPHATAFPRTLNEIVAINKYNENNSFINEEHKETILTAYKREAKRLVGESKFDNIINFETNNYWYFLQKALQYYHQNE